MEARRRTVSLICGLGDALFGRTIGGWRAKGSGRAVFSDDTVAIFGLDMDLGGIGRPGGGAGGIDDEGIEAAGGAVGCDVDSSILLLGTRFGRTVNTSSRLSSAIVVAGSSAVASSTGAGVGCSVIAVSSPAGRGSRMTNAALSPSSCEALAGLENPTWLREYGLGGALTT